MVTPGSLGVYKVRQHQQRWRETKEKIKTRIVQLTTLVLHPTAARPTFQDRVLGLDGVAPRLFGGWRILGRNPTQRGWMARLFLASHAHDERDGGHDWSCCRDEKAGRVHQYQVARNFRLARHVHVPG
jgi:hypothetical protein